MRRDTLQVLAAFLFSIAGVVHAQDVGDTRPHTIQYARGDIAGVSSPKGRVDLTADKDGRRPIGIVPEDPTGVLPPPGVTAFSSDPDDIYWKTDVSSGDASVDGRVRCVIDFGGHLIAGGDFTHAGGVTANHIASWDGTKWTPLGPGMNGSVYTLAVFKNKLIAGGTFDTAGGMPANHVAAWDGVSWSALDTGTDGTVSSLCTFHGRLIVGGGFEEAGGLPAVGVASWNGAAWSAMGTDIAGSVAALAVYDDEVIAGGSFTVGGDEHTTNVAAWDGHSWRGLVADVDIPVRAFTVYDGELIIGGNELAGWWGGLYARVLMASWDGQSWQDLSGDLTNFACEALSTYTGMLIAGGARVFGCLSGGYTTGALVSWDHDAWSSAVSPGLTSSTIDVLTVIGDKLIAGGAFHCVDGAAALRIASWDGSRWSGLGSVFRRGSKVAVYEDRLIGEGSLTELGGNYDGVTGLAFRNGTYWADIGPRFPFVIGCECVECCGPCGVVTSGPVVQTYETYRDQLIVGGGSGIGILAWNETSLTTLGLGYWVVDLAVYHDRLIALGVSNTGPIEYQGIGAWDGDSWSTLGSGDYDNLGDFRALVVYDDRLVVGGSFEAVGGVPANNVAAWDDSEWSAIGEGLDSYVTALAVFQGKLIVSGGFTSAGGAPANHIAAWDGTSWQALGDGLNIGARVLAVYDGMLVAGGNFTSAGGQPISRIAAWNGTEWSGLGSGVDKEVTGLTVYHDDLWVTGIFTTAGGKLSPSIAVWSKRGERTVAFDIRPGSCTNPVANNAERGQGKAVVPAAILGTADMNVRDIDPETIAVNGGAPVVRWGYEDVGTPADKSVDECACSAAGPDGYEDLTLKFYRDDILAQSAGSGGGSEKPNRLTVQITGKLRDGSTFGGSDCVLLVGNHGPSAAPGDVAADREFELLDNVPNPFNPETRIGFYLPTPMRVKLEIFNVQGQRVATLIDGTRGKGEQWVPWNAAGVASGVYFYRVHAGDFVETRRMLLIK